jgi:hypothetical protein
VLIHDSRGRQPAWQVITEARAAMPGRPREGDDFGSGLASGDFDGDGYADLAIGTPGRERVSVLYGAPGGVDDRRTLQLRAGNAGLPARAGRYGFVLVADDLDGERFDDLAIGAPGERDGEPSSGAIHVVFGGAGRLGEDRAHVIPRPAAGMANFGVRLRAGDIDGDERPDLAEGAPARNSAPGHATYCRSGPRGPARCRELPSAGSTSGLALGDVHGDGRADIVQGDSAHVDPADGVPVSAGEVRVWLGTSRGPRTTPITITQDSPSIPGAGEPGDEFGAVVETGDIDSDGYDDMLVAAVREDEGAGRLTYIRGSRTGYARANNHRFDQNSPDVPGSAEPGREFGSTLSVLQLTADRLLDVALAVRGGDSADERVMVVRGSKGAFVPEETRIDTLQGVASEVDAPPGGRIRLARAAGS